MAVAILEREVDTLEKAEETRALQLKSNVGVRDLSDEQHNAGISEAYAKLINPKYAKVDDILGRRAEEPVQARRELFVEKPYLVENARADAEIFRADSPVNRREIIINPQANADDSEEENEDLRPTPTTIQYKTTGVKKTVEEGKAENTGAEKRTGLSKKEKIVIAVVISVIVAMFALIIINSAILSGMSADVSSLQASLTTVKASYAGISDEVKDLTDHAFQNAENFALSIGLVR